MYSEEGELLATLSTIDTIKIYSDNRNEAIFANEEINNYFKSKRDDGSTRNDGYVIFKAIWGGAQSNLRVQVTNTDYARGARYNMQQSVTVSGRFGGEPYTLGAIQNPSGYNVHFDTTGGSLEAGKPNPAVQDTEIQGFSITGEKGYALGTWHEAERSL